MLNLNNDYSNGNLEPIPKLTQMPNLARVIQESDSCIIALTRSKTVLKLFKKFSSLEPKHFEKEVTTAARLGNMGLGPRVLSYFAPDGGVIGYELRFLRGRTASDYGQDLGRYAANWAGSELLIGLANMHVLGIYHGCLSPSNVLLTKHGVQILDVLEAKYQKEQGTLLDVQALGKGNRINMHKPDSLAYKLYDLFCMITTSLEQTPAYDRLIYFDYISKLKELGFS